MKITLPSKNIVHFKEYSPNCIARQKIPTEIGDDDDNKFSFELILSEEIDGEENVTIIPSALFYETAEDAIQDGFGVITLLGFQMEDSISKRITVLRWDGDSENYTEDYLFYDGVDFFPEDSLAELEAANEPSLI